ncbi:MAG: rhodanese-like domain-containing protein [Parahaliea sp.]
MNAEKVCLSVLIVWALASALALWPAWAQSSEYEPLQEQTHTCEPPPDQPLNPVAFAKVPARYSIDERACWASWSQSRALAQDPQGQWVDVRDAGAIYRLGLPGVAAVSLADIADKAFLKGQALVLVGSGVDLKPLSARCVRLRQSGQFKSVHVLLDGTRAWYLAGQPVLVGGSLLAPDEISPQALWRGVAGDQWRIAAIGLDSDALQHLPLPASFIASAQDLKQVVADLATQIHATHTHQARDETIHQRWLVIAATSAQQAQLRRLWREAQQPMPRSTVSSSTTPAIASIPIWLAGAWPAYGAYLRQQQTLATHAGQSLPTFCGL